MSVRVRMCVYMNMPHQCVHTWFYPWCTYSDHDREDTHASHHIPWPRHTPPWGSFTSPVFVTVAQEPSSDCIPSDINSDKPRVNRLLIK